MWRPIDPKWRTSTVVQLCESMRQAKDYAALPILADALQDAGCTDAELLSYLQAPPESTQAAQRVVAIVMSKKAADAVALIEQYAAEIADADYRETSRINYAYVMEAATRFLESRMEDDEDGQHQWHYAARTCLWFDTPDVVWAKKREFWAAYEAVTGDKPDDPDETFFRCAC